MQRGLLNDGACTKGTRCNSWHGPNTTLKAPGIRRPVLADSSVRAAGPGDEDFVRCTARADKDECLHVVCRAHVHRLADLTSASGALAVSAQLENLRAMLWQRTRPGRCHPSYTAKITCKCTSEIKRTEQTCTYMRVYSSMFSFTGTRSIARIIAGLHEFLNPQESDIIDRIGIALSW